MITPETAATTLARFDHAWAELHETVKSLSERELTEVRGPHSATRARLAALVDGTAGRSSVSTTPDAHAASTLLADVPGYTEHYKQHRDWIRELVGRRAP